jgi:tricorn protease
MNRFLTATTLALALVPGGVLAVEGSEVAGEARVLRYPDISRTHIVFVRGGDLFVVGRNGGQAIRLTAAAGEELYPKFSPDGSLIGYSAEFAGTRQVFVIPAAGGTPRQLTFYSDVGPLPIRGGTDYRVLDFTPDGQHVVVRMNRLPFDERGGRPYLVPVAGGMEQPLAIPESGGGALSPDGTQFVYTPIDADWRGWKRYRGGRAPDVWTYDLARNTARQLTTFGGLDQNPAWIGDSVYFASDRSGTLNLYAMPADAERESTVPRAITTFSDFDVLWTSGGPDAMVFEQGGWIWRHDAGREGAVRVPIRVGDDTAQALARFVKVGANIESFGLSPDGARAVFGARGEVFTVPAKNGEPRNITRTPGAREHSTSWSPDGKTIAFLSDASGEYEIWVRAQDGSGEARRVTRDGSVWRFPPVWSPDSSRLAYADKDLRLRVVAVADGTTREVDRGGFEDITEYVWSPDSRWLAYAKTNATRMQSIWVWSLASGKSTQLTSDHANEFSPAFDPKGRYLYFLSNRDYAGLTFSAFEFNYLYVNATRIYAATLASDGPALNAPKSDEVGTKPPEPAAKDAKKGAPAPLRFDVEGFDRRVVALNVPPGNYQGLSANADAVFFAAAEPQGPGKLRTFALDGDKPEDVAAGVAAYAISADGNKLLLRTGNDWAIVDAKPAQDPGQSKLALDRMELRIDPRVEWNQMYVDAWRILRDWFYDPGMHGGIERWNAIRERYAPLAARVASREDFNYVLHELSGEANAGHVYVERGGSAPAAVERKAGGLLGAEFEAHPSGYFRIAKIFPGENWDAANRSPLTEAGVVVATGEYLIAVDGVDARSVANVYALLENKAERLVELSINARPSADGARIVKVKTIANERTLRYLEWVAQRRAMVDRLSGGRIGYIHVPNTAQDGNRELNRWLAPLAHKDALIIDDRYNGGGFIPDRMIEMLARTPLNYWKRRGLEPQPTPGIVHDGPKAMLINGMSSSGGDALPYYFRKLGLGTLIGTRTWGGLIGISGNPSLVDGGSILAATFRFMSAEDGTWTVENEGVAPDIEVVDRPELVAAGRDPSLEKAVEVLLEQLRATPPRKISAPPAPTRFD